MPIKLGVEVIVPQHGLIEIGKINASCLSQDDQQLFRASVAKQLQMHSLK